MKTRLWKWGISITLLLFMIGYMLPILIPLPSKRSRTSCASNMKQFGLSMKMYSNEHEEGLYPSLSSEPGRLFWDVVPMYPGYAPDPTSSICSLDEDADTRMNWVKGDTRARFELKPGIEPEENVDDWSYWYLGYVLFDDEDVKSFAEYYRRALAMGEGVEGDIALTNGKTLSTAQLWEKRLPLRDSISEKLRGYSNLYRLRANVERRLFEPGSESEPNDDHIAVMLQSRIPVLIERPENHDMPGGMVLYLSGHVEFIPYPGKWPMTEKTIGILNELDAMGEH